MDGAVWQRLVPDRLDVHGLAISFKEGRRLEDTFCSMGPWPVGPILRVAKASLTWFYAVILM